MKYLSVCSGIEAATVAWHSLGWKPLAFSEIEKFPAAVLAHHYPNTPNLGDMTKFKEWENYVPDILVGGTPCQSFSVAGLRKGLDDPRGNLMLAYVAIADRYRPRWIVWENVLGVLSSNGGKDFGTFLGALGEIGYGFAYRVLDAQYFGVPQRRRRVFVVGHLGDWRRAAAVLFEQHSLSGNPPPSREKGKAVAALTANGVGTCGADDNQGQAGHLITFGGNNTAGPIEISTACNAHGGTGRLDFESETFVCGTLQANGKAAGSATQQDAESGMLVVSQYGNIAGSLTARHDGQNVVAFTQNQLGDVLTGDISPSVGTNQNATGRNTPKVMSAMQVRRLTPEECEKLQGFSPGYTNIPWRNKTESPDGPRYKALGNSMAVPCMKWIGERINLADLI